MSAVVFLALGSNLGDRAANLQAAQRALPPAVRLVAISPIYETPPWGILEQPAFLNQALKAETDLSPQDLLAYLKRLEVQLGRQPGQRYGPRQIDLDILFYADRVLETEKLSIPHPRLAERAFVLVPLADIAPDLRHPLTGKTAKEMLELLDTTGIHLFGE
jgi:2-amino-4-hydroxy-6-hydroxymethyldihydropteridine diphosphokinase